MTDFNIADLGSALDAPTGVSYKGQTKSWNTGDDVADLVRDIENCTQLTYLDLEGNTLGVPAAERIGEALKKHPEFKNALWKDLFTRRLKTEIPRALEHMGRGMIAANAALAVLDLSDNALGPDGMVGLIELLSSPTCYSLQELYLNNCGLGIGGGKMLSKALLECHEKGSSIGRPLCLKVLVAGRNRLENAGAKALAGLFSELETLEHIAMPQNGIYYDGISALSKAFMLNSNMKILNLNDNTIRAKGAESLAEALYTMQKLEEINFGDCLLKTKGAVLIAEALQDGHPDLKILNLGFNEIGPDGGIKVALALDNKKNLESVILDGNQFGYECRERIKEILREQSNDNVLGTLSEDESDAEDEQENEVNDEEGEEDENGEEDDEYTDEEAHYGDETDEEGGEGFNYVAALTGKTVNGSANTTDHTILENPTIESFCMAKVPNLEMFNQLEETNKTEAFREFFKSYKGDDYLTCLIFTILKCSSFGDASPEAAEVATDLYKDAFDYAKSNNELTRVKNFFLIQLGLLKCEEKKFHPEYNVKACRNVLKNAIAKDVFPEDVQKTFNLFLERFA